MLVARMSGTRTSNTSVAEDAPLPVVDSPQGLEDFRGGAFAPSYLPAVVVLVLTKI